MSCMNGVRVVVVQDHAARTAAGTADTVGYTSNELQIGFHLHWPCSCCCCTGREALGLVLSAVSVDGATGLQEFNPFLATHYCADRN